jgi:hypothetical protein
MDGFGLDFFKHIMLQIVYNKYSFFICCVQYNNEKEITISQSISTLSILIIDSYSRLSQNLKQIFLCKYFWTILPVNQVGCIWILNYIFRDRGAFLKRLWISKGIAKFRRRINVLFFRKYRRSVAKQLNYGGKLN